MSSEPIDDIGNWDSEASEGCSENEDCDPKDGDDDQVVFLQNNEKSIKKNDTGVEKEDFLSRILETFKKEKSVKFDMTDSDFLSKGFVVGFNGSKVFSMHNSSVITFEISLTTPVRQYTDQKMFRCVEITDLVYIINQ